MAELVACLLVELKVKGLKHRCLIHNAHIEKILSFCKISDLKNNTFK